MKTFGDTVNRLAGVFVLKPESLYCIVFTAASSKVRKFDQDLKSLFYYVFYLKFKGDRVR